MAIVTGCISVLVAVVALGFLMLGWIIPLVIGAVWRQDHRPGARTWMVLASVWGGVALLIVAGTVAVIVLNMRGSGFSTQDYLETAEFEPAKYNGALRTARVQFSGDGCLIASCGTDEETRFTTTNGVFTVPDGQLDVRRYQATATDEAGRKWTADVECNSTSESPDVELGTDRTLNVGPPFKASVEVSASPVSDMITMVPMYVDRGNNKTTITCEKQTAPKFEVLDAAGKVVWSGDFQYG